MRTLFVLLAVWSMAISGIMATNVEGGQHIIISQPVEGDLYLGGNTLEIGAYVNGDLIAAGKVCTIRDTIREDAVVVAQEIFLEGPVIDDARLAGGQVHIRANIYGDLIVGAGNVTIDREVIIHGNVYAAGGTIRLHGRVMGEVKLAGGDIYFDGVMERNASLKGGNIRIAGVLNGPMELAAENLALESGASFYQEVRYWTKNGEIDFGNSLKENSRAVFDESLDEKLDDGDWKRALGIGGAFFAIARLLAAALIILLLSWAFSNFFRRTSKRLVNNYAPSLGYGFLYLLGMPLLILIAFVTIIGIPVGLFSLATYGLSLGFAHILTAVLAAHFWQTYRQIRWQKRKTILVAIGIFAVLKLLSWIPILGWIISLVAVALTFGAILLELLRKKEPEDLVPEEI